MVRFLISGEPGGAHVGGAEGRREGDSLLDHVVQFTDQVLKYLYTYGTHDKGTHCSGRVATVFILIYLNYFFSIFFQFSFMLICDWTKWSDDVGKLRSMLPYCSGL